MRSPKANSVLSFIESDRGALLISIFISTVIWLLVKLSKDDFITETEIFFEYSVPGNKLYTEPPPKHAWVWARGKGFDLLSDLFAKRPKVVRYELADAAKQTISSAQLRAKIGETLQARGLRLDELGMDVITVQLEEAASKEVRVRLDAELSFSSNYRLIDSMKLTPPQVLATGPASLVSKLTEQPTQKLKLQGIAAPETKAKIPLMRHENPQLTFHPDTVEVSIRADRFTEKTIMAPISVINTADSIEVFPRMVQLSFRVSLGKFEEVGGSDFSVEADFSKIEASGNTLPLRVSKAPDFVDNISVSPKAVEYYIRAPAKRIH